MENSRYPNRLRKYRRIFCLSQKDVSKMLGLKTTSPLSRWEKGISFPNIVQLFQLSRIYKALPNELYEGIWQSISKEIAILEQSLLAQPEPVIINEKYYL